MPKPLTLKRWAFLVLLATAVACVIVVAGLLIVTRDWFSESEADDRHTRTLEIDTSDDRTVYAGPLREDGTIDYITAINQSLREDVTEENNAFRGLARVLRLQYPFEDDAAAIDRALGISSDEVDDAVTFTNWHGTYHRYIETESSLTEDDTKELLSALLDSQLSIESTRKLSKWIEVNQKALSLSSDVLELDRYWIPLIHEPGYTGLLASIWYPHTILIRELAHCYRVQLVLAAEVGDADTTRSSLQSLLRLARLHSQAPSLVDGLVAISIESQAIFAIRDLLNHGPMDKQILDHFAKEWQPSDGRKTIVEQIDRWERSILLDGLMQVASGRSDTTEIIDGTPDQRPIDQLFVDRRFDINDGLAIINSEFDRLVEAMSHNTYAECARALEAYKLDFEQQQEWVEARLYIHEGNERFLNGQMPSAEHTEVLSRYYTFITMPAYAAAYRTDLRATANYRNVYAAIAVERYYADIGQLPDSLDQLVPDYLAAIPVDPFDQHPLKYRRIVNGYSVYSLGDNLRDDEGVHDFEDGDIAIVVERFNTSESE